MDPISEWQPGIIRAEACTSEETDDSSMEQDDPTAAEIRGNLLPRVAKDSQQFLPHRVLDGILTNDIIRSVLEKDVTTKSLTQSELIDAGLASNPREGCQKRIKILAVLILIEKPGCIVKFIKKRVWDSALPLETDDKFFNSWKVKDRDDFCQWQWVMLAPVIDFTTTTHCEFDFRIPMPFLQPLSRDPDLAGAHGQVSEIKIHKHHQIRRSSWTEDSHAAYAVKQLKLENDDTFNNERDALARFSGPGRAHRNLIELLFSYERGSEKYLVFPWANCDLRQFWKIQQQHCPSSKNFIWLLRQCRGLADGLFKVHEKDDQQISGRHGDIKPENILFFEGLQGEKGRFVLADFTLMRFHSSNITSTVANRVGYSRTYRPPEVHDKSGVRATPKYDIWTLGCVYLEFVTWHLLGYEAIAGDSFDTADGPYESFSTARHSDDDMRDTCFVEDKFFVWDEKQRPVVKDSVKQWVSFLKGHRYASPALRAFLDRIMTRMVVPNPDDRCNMGELLDHLRTILSDCHHSDTYSIPGHRNPGDIITETQYPRPFDPVSSAYGRVVRHKRQENSDPPDSQSESDLKLITSIVLGSENVTPPAEASTASLRIMGPTCAQLNQAHSRLDPPLREETECTAMPVVNQSVIPEATLIEETEQYDRVSEHRMNEEQEMIGRQNRKPLQRLRASAKMMGQKGRLLLLSGRRVLETWKQKAGDTCRKFRDGRQPEGLKSD